KQLFGSLLRAMMLHDCREDQFPPQKVMDLVLSTDDKTKGECGKGILVLSPPGQAPDMSFTREVIVRVRINILKNELKRAVDKDGQLKVSLVELNRQLKERLALPGDATGSYPVTPRLAESFWRHQADPRTWGEMFLILSPREAEQAI